MKDLLPTTFETVNYYGQGKNVPLTEAEYLDLKSRSSRLNYRLDKMSRQISDGRNYRLHDAYNALLQFIEKDGDTPPINDTIDAPLAPRASKEVLYISRKDYEELRSKYGAVIREPVVDNLGVPGWHIAVIGETTSPGIKEAVEAYCMKQIGEE